MYAVSLTTFVWVSENSYNFSFYNLFYLGATATDSLSAGYRTILIDDCCRGVDLTDIESTKETVLGNHGVIVHSREVKNPFLLSHSYSSPTHSSNNPSTTKATKHRPQHMHRVTFVALFSLNLAQQLTISPF